MSWYTPAAELQGKGARAAKPGSLAGLHEARKRHQGQFFTPAAVAELAWALVSPYANAGEGEKITLFDNSVGSGRLLQYADPKRHVLYGVDIDPVAVERLSEAAAAAGFSRDFLTARMEDTRPGRFDIGLINPAFSIQLESPHLAPYPCTHWGLHGPHTSALSHAYALDQALASCSLVAAILPASYIAEIQRQPASSERLAAIVRLPSSAFRESGANVATGIAVFDSLPRVAPPIVYGVGDYSGPQDLTRLGKVLGLSFRPRGERSKIGVRQTEIDRPSINLPVTGEREVRVVHDGRRLRLKFGCGLTQAKVLNAILKAPVERIEHHRHPKGLTYTGQLKLDIEVHLALPDPQASFKALVDEIREAGGEPSVDPGLERYFARRVREQARAATPFHRTVKVAAEAGGAGQVRARPKQHMALDTRRFGSPILDPKDVLDMEVVGTRETPEFKISVGGWEKTFTEEDFRARFVRVDIIDGGRDWQKIHAGKRAAFPEVAKMWTGRAKAKGLDKILSWDYQFDDLIEAAMSPRGAAVAWSPGMGKARLALCLALLRGGKHNLIVVEAGLLEEMLIEIMKLGLDQGLYQFLERPEQLNDLRTLNIISYERLRRPIEASNKRMTWARRLRRRLNTVVCDEADHLSHLDTAQTRAVWMLSPKWRYALAGEPVSNYPRDLLPVISWAIGDGTAAQPYGYHHPYIEAPLRKSAQYATRGVDTFREKYVCTQWVTREFEDQMAAGAKREIPRIRNLAGYRAFHAPHLLRRVPEEPECAKYLPYPRWRVITRSIEWDREHLAHYLRVSDQYRQWFEAELRAAQMDGRNLNMVQVLARIGAVTAAANHPFAPAKRCPVFATETSKEAAALERLEWLSQNGHKTILYAHSPALLERLARQLKNRGIEAVTFHGQKTVKARMRELDRRFRFGSAPVLLASLGVSQKGLNIPQADRVIFYSRSWSAKAEAQAMKRVLRPQQKRRVLFEFLHLEGSIDVYQGQMVDFKADASAAGIDWQESRYEETEFLHLDTILGRFCKELEELHGIHRQQLREAAAA